MVVGWVFEFFVGLVLCLVGVFGYVVPSSANLVDHVFKHVQMIQPAKHQPNKELISILVKE